MSSNPSDEKNLEKISQISNKKDFDKQKEAEDQKRNMFSKMKCKTAY